MNNKELLSQIYCIDERGPQEYTEVGRSIVRSTLLLLTDELDKVKVKNGAKVVNFQEGRKNGHNTVLRWIEI